MANFDLLRQLSKSSGGKIIMLVLDGLGGMPVTLDGPTALEMARTPLMDKLAKEGTLGRTIPIARGITPGSGPAHLSLFGYDPISNDIGRGVLSALGIGVDLQPGDVAARGNFCTVDADGNITDRRAGRIGGDIAKPLVDKLDQIEVDGITTEVRHVKEYRFSLVLRGEGLNGELADTDPQATGVPTLPPTAEVPEAARTVAAVDAWLAKAREVLKDDAPANMVTLRGFGQDPGLPQFDDVYKLRAACCAVYPMYKGVSRLVGMDVLPSAPDDTPRDQFARVAEHWDEYDFFFVHIKPTDSRGEDGNQPAKAVVIEMVDEALPEMLALNPDVLIVTGDHSTPAKMRAHSWHPVPTLLWAPDTHLSDSAETFGERPAMLGGLGTFHATELMSLALGHAQRLNKYGA